MPQDAASPGAALLRVLDDALSSDIAYLDGYGPIDDHTATLLTAAAPSLRRLLTHPHTGVVLALGRETYTVPADLRAYLRLRDGTCRFPGCSRAAARCDVDHTTAYVTGGTTDATNLAHLC
ncbi:HNH endonuclease signature motif containing protein, partial [Luteimicrobium sp. DT211]|uniref:HNH endonuclease signature motif containing protein n=1 Tax=Luteimicrobium sp. DT211 TaxID=3393412 RepID=UPI003CF477ED